MAIIKFVDADLVNGKVELEVVNGCNLVMDFTDWRAFRHLLSECDSVVREYPFVAHLLPVNEYDRYARPKADAAYSILQKAKCVTQML